MSKVGNNIQKFRKAKNMTQDQLAEELNVTRQAVSNWETNKTQPDIETLEKLAEVLEVSIEELIYGEPKKPVQIVMESGSKASKAGISFGAALAIVISYTKWHSIGWAIVHGALSWIYVIYYMLKYL